MAECRASSAINLACDSQAIMLFLKDRCSTREAAGRLLDFLLSKMEEEISAVQGYLQDQKHDMFLSKQYGELLQSISQARNAIEFLRAATPRLLEAIPEVHVHAFDANNDKSSSSNPYNDIVRAASQEIRTFLVEEEKFLAAG